MYHTSPNPITEITLDGLYDDGLFFASKPYVMTGAVDFVTYEIDVESLEIADVWNLDEAFKTISEFASFFSIAEDLATDILMENENIASYTEDFEDEWITQKFQLRAAKELGFNAVWLRDEQGAALLVSMQQNLSLIKTV
jgi:hypothetical protein